MRTLYIPTLGEVIELAQPWTFQLFNESRNESMMVHVGDTRSIKYAWSHKLPMTSIAATITTGARLQFDRYYIRKNLEDFDSVTFSYLDKKVKLDRRTVTPRFWVKLADVNRMVIV